MPAYNAAETLTMTYGAIPAGIADEIILVDDASHDATVETAKSLGIPIIRHP
ncbi:MAG: glycosyltransferase, partial [Thermoplasmata archaeon]